MNVNSYLFSLCVPSPAATVPTACLCIHSLRIRVEARANTLERAVIDQRLQFVQTAVQSYPTEDLRTADTSCPSRTSAEHFT